MGFLSLFISIFGESVGKTIDKLNFRRNRITFRQYMFLVFLAMSVSMLAFILLAKEPFPRFTFMPLVLVILIAAFSFGSNVFDCLSLKMDDLSLREPLVDFEPVMAGLIGYVVFPAERKTAFLVAFIIGAFIVRWGIHRRKLRKFQTRGMFYLWIAVILQAILPPLYKEALIYLSPVYIAFFRIVSIFVLTSIFFPVKKLKGLSTTKVLYSLASGFAYAVGAVASLYAIKVLGVVLTMLFLMLGPSLRYMAGYFILKEKVRKGEVISSTLLAGVVLVAAVVR
jgi:drug/metabolite transporter (DMT)-like permease